MSSTTTNIFATIFGPSLYSTENTFILLATIGVLLAYYYYANVYTYFKKRGLKGPTPYPLVGSMIVQMLSDRTKLEQEWVQKYGKIYGFFQGTKSRITIADAEVLRNIAIKDFSSFTNHEQIKLMNDYQKNFIFFTQDEQWKRMRSIQTPTFTSGKIKRMYKLLSRCADDLVMNFSEELEDGNKKISEAITDVRKIYNRYTLDAISTAAYTIKLERKAMKDNDKSPRDIFAAKALKIFEFRLTRLMISLTVPMPLLRLINFEFTPSKHFLDLEKHLRPLLEQRRNAVRKADDYLQILVDARMDEQLKLDDLDDKENHHAGLTRDSLKNDQVNLIKDLTDAQSNNDGDQKQSNGTTVTLPGSKLKLTDKEIISSALFLLVVGIETTAILLTHCTYALAFHQDIQRKLYEAIKAIARKDPKSDEYSFEYDELTSCEYLDAVISETLRIIPPVLMVDRIAGQDYLIEKYNVQLKKGDKLMMNFCAIMSNPEYWPEPGKFDPERFVGENKKKIVPGSYCPFGMGPRHCLGMRFSLTEAKLALAKVLMKFKFTPAPNTSFPPVFKMTNGLSQMKNTNVKLSVR